MPSHPNLPGGGLTLGGLLMALRRQTPIIIVMGLLGFGSAVAYLNVAVFVHTATWQVIPAQNDSSRLSSGGSVAAAGLSSLVGLNLGAGQSASNFGVYQEGLKSYPVASVLARDPELMRAIFYNRWDAENRRWIMQKGGLGRFSDGVKSALGLPVYPVSQPSVEDLVSFVRGGLTISENERRSIVTLTFRHEKPELAATVLRRLHEASNDLLRAKMLAQSTEYVEYIKRRLRVTEMAEYRLAMTQLLGEQGKIQMITSSTLPYAAAPLGEISLSDRPTDPQPLLVLAGGLIAGLIVGGMIATLRSGIVSRQQIDV